MKENEQNKGGGKEIQFLHANAYTPGCYNELFKELSDYKIFAPFQRPLWNNSSPSDLHSWSLFRDDIIEHMELMNRSGVIGMGHSMGGIVALLASLKNPRLFSQLILIDPVIIPGLFASFTRLMPFQLKERYIPIVKIAMKRKDKWSGKEQARSHFLSKKIFQRFSKNAFDDFMQNGLSEIEEGVTLSYPKRWEAQVYGTAPNLWNQLSKVSCPITIIRGEFSDVLTDRTWSLIKRKMKNAKFLEIKKAGHLVPFERPKECAELIKSQIEN